MAYQKTIHFSSGSELLTTSGTLVRAIQVPQGALAKLSKPSPYNEALDSDVVSTPTVQSEGNNQNITAEPTATDFSKPVDVVALLSKEEPAIQTTQVPTGSEGEPAYGVETKPDNVIQFPSINQEPVMAEETNPVVSAITDHKVLEFQSSNQDLEELGDTLARLEEAQNVTAALLMQAKEAYQRVQGTEEYKKVA